MRRASSDSGFTANSPPRGIECLVVNPADIPKSQKDKLQRTDTNDSRNIGYRLLKGELRGIHVPDDQQEADRYFFAIAKNIQRPHPMQKPNKRTFSLLRHRFAT